MSLRGQFTLDLTYHHVAYRQANDERVGHVAQRLVPREHEDQHSVPEEAYRAAVNQTTCFKRTPLTQHENHREDCRKNVRFRSQRIRNVFRIARRVVTSVGRE